MKKVLLVLVVSVGFCLFVIWVMIEIDVLGLYILDIVKGFK